MFRNVSPDACMTYLFGRDSAGEAVLVDPCLGRVQEYLDLLARDGLKLTHVVDTHTHADHLSAGGALRDATDCDYLMHGSAPAPCVTGRLDEGEPVELAGVKVRILHTPGHTKDSISLLVDDRILTGDVLFLDDGGAGRSDLPGGDPGEHWDSLQRILTLPDHLTVFPAHEYRQRQPSNLAHQRHSNPHLASRSRDEFISFLQDLKLGPAEWMKAVLVANAECTRDPNAVPIPTDVPACEVKGTMGFEGRDIPVEEIDVTTLRGLLGGGSAPVLLDVREPEELVGPLGVLDGVRHIPIGELMERAGELEANRERDIVTVCKKGGRARTAAQILIDRGFKRVKVLAGGMKGWREAGR